MIDIDLLAPIRPRRATAWARAWACVRPYSPWLITLATIAALLGVQIGLGRAERRLDAALARARVTASHVERSAQRVQSLEEQEARLRSTELAVQSVRSRRRTGVAPVLAVLSGALPEDVWLERLDVRRAEMTIQGRGQSLSSLVTLANQLSALPVFDGPTDLSEVRHARPVSVSAPPGPVPEPNSGRARGTTTSVDGSAFTFTLRGRLRPAETQKRSTRP
ncbi:MAG: hypothetical protein GEV06_23630 [Luteitalea sp.]|nr:hypothetical protein [Luteitalea sp.]